MTMQARQFKLLAARPTTRMCVARPPWRGACKLRTSAGSRAFAGQRGTAKLEFAIITLVTAVLITVALTRLAELGSQGQQAGQEFKQSQERAASALEQAACATASASKQTSACGVSR